MGVSHSERDTRRWRRAVAVERASDPWGELIDRICLQRRTIGKILVDCSPLLLKENANNLCGLRSVSSKRQPERFVAGSTVRIRADTPSSCLHMMLKPTRSRHEGGTNLLCVTMRLESRASTHSNMASKLFPPAAVQYLPDCPCGHSQLLDPRDTCCKASVSRRRSCLRVTDLPFRL